MQPITVGRYDSDPTAQGIIRPADDTWQLVVDKDGYPHLYVKVNIADHDDTRDGWFCVEDMLPEGVTIPDLMKGSFGGRLTPEEEEAAHREHLESRGRNGIPCPRS